MTIRGSRTTTPTDRAARGTARGHDRVDLAMLSPAFECGYLASVVAVAHRRSDETERSLQDRAGSAWMTGSCAPPIATSLARNMITLVMSSQIAQTMKDANPNAPMASPVVAIE